MAMSQDAKDNVASNYRRMFKERFGKDFPGSDAVIFGFWANAAGAPTPQDQDDWVLEDMERV